MKKTDESQELIDYYIKPIHHLFDMEGVTEISVNRFDEVFIKRYGRFEFMDKVAFTDEKHVKSLVNQIGVSLGQFIDDKANPVLDARLQDGTRICAVLSPRSTRGTSISFRLFPKKPITADDLVTFENITQEMMDFLRAAIRCGSNILVAGGTESGKTTLLNALSGFIPEDERVICVEDTQELNICVKNRVMLEAPVRRTRAGEQSVDMQYFIRTALRKNPTWIIVGEVRDVGAATALLHASNTGHYVMSTIHSNSAKDGINRMQILIAGNGDLPFDVVGAQVKNNLDLIVFVEKTPNHGRRACSDGVRPAGGWGFWFTLSLKSMRPVILFLSTGTLVEYS